MKEKVMINFASSSSQIKSSQKDFRIIEYLRSLTDDFLSSIPKNGASFLFSLRSEIDLIIKFCYLLLTKFGNGTFGEQYCNLSEVTQGNLRKPSYKRLFLLIIFTLIPTYFSRKIRSFNLEPNERSIRSIIFKLLVPLTSCLNLLHTAIFLRNGKFMNISKRILGIRYVDGTLTNSTNNKYQFLITLLLVQFFVIAVRTINYCYSKDEKLSTITQTQSKPLELYQFNDGKKKPVTNFRCQLCLNFCQLPTATPCGHIFCWKCILKWIQLNQACSSCRLEFLPQELIFLRHYDQVPE